MWRVTRVFNIPPLEILATFVFLKFLWNLLSIVNGKIEYERNWKRYFIPTRNWLSLRTVIFSHIAGLHTTVMVGWSVGPMVYSLVSLSIRRQHPPNTVPANPKIRLYGIQGLRPFLSFSVSFTSHWRITKIRQEQIDYVRPLISLRFFILGSVKKRTSGVQLRI